MNLLAEIIRCIDYRVQNTQRWTLVVLSTTATVTTVWIWNQVYNSDDGIYDRIRSFLFRLVRKVPSVRRQIEEKSQQAYAGMCAKMHEQCGADTILYLSSLPSDGVTADQVLSTVKQYATFGRYSYSQGQLSGTVYHGSHQLTELMTEVYRHTAWTNPLHPSVFPGVRRMEAEIVRMCCSMFNGGAAACGSVTSGGTESIILAIKACRDWARAERGVRRPEIIVPVTAHAAFDKGAQLLGVQIRHIAVDPVTLCVDEAAMKRSISANTVMLACSAPNFPYGNMDPIADVAALGSRYGVPVHVDACLGGFLLAFMTDAGFTVPPFDFRLAGVTSISADTHKYGYAPKGSSVVLYSGAWLHHHQYSVQPDWPGGIYASPSLAGSRSGAVIAGCWAAMRYFGRSGYVDATRKIIDTTRYLRKELSSVAGLRVMGQCEVSVIALQSSVFNIYVLLDRLDDRGWNWNALQAPAAIHIAVTYCHTQSGIAERLATDVRQLCEQLLAESQHHAQPQSETAALYGVTSTVADRSLVSELGWCYLDSLYCTS